MTLDLAFVALALALVAIAVIQFLLAIVRRRHQTRDLLLAMLFAALAIGVWWTTVRTPFTVH
jgi:uncharacterized membrane protein